jgi:hypothetical protein
MRERYSPYVAALFIAMVFATMGNVQADDKADTKSVTLNVTGMT